MLDHEMVILNEFLFQFFIYNAVILDVISQISKIKWLRTITHNIKGYSMKMLQYHFGPLHVILISILWEVKFNIVFGRIFLKSSCQMTRMSFPELRNSTYFILCFLLTGTIVKYIVYLKIELQIFLSKRNNLFWFHNWIYKGKLC